MSNEFLEDGTAAIAWAKLNKPLFINLAKELKLRDPATYVQMKHTPWLDNIIRYGGVHLGQDAKTAIQSRKIREQKASEWEDEKEVQLTKVAGL